MIPLETILLIISSEVDIIFCGIVLSDVLFKRKLWRKGTVVTKKGTYTFTPHSAKEQEQK